MKRSERDKSVKKALEYYERANIRLTEAEKENIEAADFGLGNIDKVGLQLLTYINTQRVCAKEMVLFPGQTCPEHWHIGTNREPGKEETFRCRFGTVYLYVDGERNTSKLRAAMPETVVTVFHEIVLEEGEQYTIMPGVKHWFQAGEKGAVISEFSTHSTDETDRFTDPAVVRIPVLEEETCL